MTQAVCMAKIQPAELSYTFILPAASGTMYIDIAQCASMVNRRLYRQGKNYHVSRVSAVMGGGGMITLSTLPDTWVTSNAYVKAFSLWKAMQNRVLKDNPSISGKWRDFKVFFDTAHSAGGTAASGPTLNNKPVGTDDVAVKDGEWNMSDLVLPQHDVDPATGVVLAADEFLVHMIGADIGGPLPAALSSGGIVKMYQDTRARQNQDPLVPGAMAESWGTQLTDSGSQDPELADLIDAENDLPPYDNDEYPGGGTGNLDVGITQSVLLASASLPTDKDLGFKCPLGLIKVKWQVETYLGVRLIIDLVPGTYKGLHCTDVRQ